MVADSPPTSPGDAQSRQEYDKNHKYAKNKNHTANNLTKTNSVPCKQSNIIKEESESGSVDVYNIYDTETISDTVSDTRRRVERTKTNTADFECKEEIPS